MRRKIEISIPECLEPNCAKCKLFQYHYDQSLSLHSQLASSSQSVNYNNSPGLQESQDSCGSQVVDLVSQEFVEPPVNRDSGDIQDFEEKEGMKRFKRPLAKTVVEDRAGETSSASNGHKTDTDIGPEKIRYSVLWAKPSTRKHKKWEGDGYLIISGSHLRLVDENGKTMDACDMKNLPDFESGLIMKVGGKEIELQDLCDSVPGEKSNSISTQPSVLKPQPVKKATANPVESKLPGFVRKAFVSTKPATQNPDLHGAPEASQKTSRQNHSGEKTKYSVLWAKPSTRKHKVWEGDGFLIVSGTSLVLLNEAGKIMGSSQFDELPELESGVILRVAGKEVQLQDLCEEIDDSVDTNSTSQRQEEPKKVQAVSVGRKPFVVPCQAGSYTPMDRGSKNTSKPMFDPEATGALVLPDPDDQHQLQYNPDDLPVVKVVVDPHISRQLRQHQREGVEFLYRSVYLDASVPTGAILADDMGLGKTLQCISLLWTLHRQGPYGRKEVCNRTLIVTPSSLVHNWEKEVLRWLGNERLRTFSVSSQKPVEQCPGNIPVIIISYEMATRSEVVLKSKKFDLIICDEAHKIKNRKNQAYQLIQNLNCPRRVLLTGTPIQNDLMELFTLVELIRPGALGTENEFRNKFVHPIEKSIDINRETASAASAATELNSLMSHFLLRRDASVMLKYLPNRVTQVVFCHPSALQREIYEAISSSSEAEKIISGSSHSPLSLILLLKKLCNHPQLVHPKVSADKIDVDLLKCYPATYNQKSPSAKDSGKLEVLMQMLVRFQAEKQKVVVVSHYTQTLTLIEDQCSSRGFHLLRLDGSVVSKDRMSIVNKFNNSGDACIFLLSSKAGGVGLNLQSSSKIILYDIDWNPAHDAQAMARCWRPGQKKETFIYRLLTAGTIEERIYQRQISKQTVSGSVVDLLQSDSPSFSKKELRDIFTFFNEGCVTHELLGCDCSCDGKLSEATMEEPPLKRPKQNNTKNRIGELLHWEHYDFEHLKALNVDPMLCHPAIDFVFRNKFSNDSKDYDDNIHELENAPTDDLDADFDFGDDQSSTSDNDL